MAVFPSWFSHVILLCKVFLVICTEQSSITTVSSADVITTVESGEQITELSSGSIIPLAEVYSANETTESIRTTTTCGNTTFAVVVGQAFPTNVSLTINANTNGTFCAFTLVVNCTTNNDWPWIVDRSPHFEFELENSSSTIILDELAEFTIYDCDFTGSGNWLVITGITTSEDVPSSPENVSTTSITPTSFNLSWSEPARIPTILYGYNITITRGNVYSSNHSWTNCLNETDIVETYIENSTLYSFENALADFNYDVSISAWSRIGMGSSENISLATPSSASEPPQNVAKNISFTNSTRNVNMNLILSWEAPCNTNGPVTYFVIEALGYYLYNSSITSNNTYWTLIQPDAIHYYTIPNLLSASNYTVTLYANNSLDNIPGKNVSFQFETIENYPSAPEVGETLITASNITFKWSEPSNNPGNITGYNFNVDSIKLNWIQTELCSLEKLEYNSSKLQDTSVTMNVTPGTIYNVSISANTSLGEGNATSLQVESSMKWPELGNISNTVNQYAVDEDLYNVSGVISFTPGCFNGNFMKYVITFLGERDGYDDHNDTDELSDYSISQYSFSLRPEHAYTVNVTIHNTEFQITNSTEFSSPAGVPTFNEEIIATIEVNTTSTEASLTLRKEFFSSSYGTVMYLAIIVSSENVTGGNIYTWENESEWPVPKADADIYYQATPAFWQPFEDTDSVDYVIGQDETCEDQSECCNAPLLSDRTYYIFVRVFNSNFYRNTMAITIVTDPLSKLGLILGIIVGFLAASIAGFIGFILWRKGVINYTNKRIVDDPSQENESDSDLLIAFLNKEHSKSETELSKSKFVDYVNYLELNPEILNKQWQDLETKSVEVYEELKNQFALLPENKRKNRYVNILPFDHSRVKLNIDEDDEIASDYINASYIKGFSNKHEYIATQGPLPHTVRDFWKMVFQENVSMIIMVSRFIENRKEKCYKYFPNNHETMLIGDDLEVRCCTELYFEIYYVRTLQIRKDLRQLTVTHMQFLEWPDFDVPDGTSNLLLFCHQMRNRWACEGGLIVVHCSAGVGRTGTIIATDILTRALATKKTLDVFNTVLEMRRNRKSMVQSEKQYMYIYQLIKSLLEDPITEDDEDPNHLYANVVVPSKHSIAIVESPL